MIFVKKKPSESLETFEQQKPVILNCGGGGAILPPHPERSLAAAAAAGVFNEFVHPSDSVLRLRADSSCSEPVVSPCEKEVQSEPTKLADWERAALKFPLYYVDATMDTAFPSQFQTNQMSPL